MGHLTIITHNFQDISSYFGLAKIKVQPPRKLYHPVLPYRSLGKLKFSYVPNLHGRWKSAWLYQFCRWKSHQRHVVCPRNPNGSVKRIRNLKKKLWNLSFWAIVSIWHFFGWGVLFAKYINTFLKIKQEASDFLPSVTPKSQNVTIFNNTKKKRA